MGKSPMKSKSETLEKGGKAPFGKDTGKPVEKAVASTSPMRKGKYEGDDKMGKYR